ncbi:MAG: aminoacetone oxidase family FAD-binding enzyme, partial [Spirochaetota bacterium]
MNNPKKVAVIGAGASGMIAAICAARAGASVTVFEKQKKPGRKLGITGNGQCNITNTGIDMRRYHGHNPQFVHNIFSRCGLDQTREFFETIGIPFVERKNGKLYPHCLQAQSVVDILEYEMQRAGCELIIHRRIDHIERSGSGLLLTSAGQEKMVFDAAIYAPGSCAYPQLGAEETVYDIARRTGHTVYDPFPAILPVTIPLKALHRLEGIKWDCGMKAVSGGKTVSASEGELLFTKYGISGPATLEISRGINESLIKRNEASVLIDFFPGHTPAQLRELCDVLLSDPDKSVSFALLGVLKKRMPEIILQVIGLDPEKKCGALSQKEQEKILAALKGFTLAPGGPRAFS